jgi:hypothetical protein
LGGRENFTSILERSWIEGKASVGEKEVARSLEILKQAPMHKIPLSSDISGSMTDKRSVVDFVTDPIVVRLPESNVSEVYSKLADDVILEILRQQLDAQIVPSISYIESRGGIVLRYYEASKVSEYVIPTAELRRRDAKTGKRLANSSTDLSTVKPINFDFKGNYGVAIQWSDGHYADIFPFDILLQIAQEDFSKL